MDTIRYKSDKSKPFVTSGGDDKTCIVSSSPGNSGRTRNESIRKNITNRGKQTEKNT